MELPINTIVILVVLLVALSIMLILITRSGHDLVDIGGAKIEGAGGASSCVGVVVGQKTQLQNVIYHIIKTVIVFVNSIENKLSNNPVTAICFDNQS